MIKDKWKVFAMNEVLSGYKGGAELFDKINLAEDSELEDLLEKYEAIVCQDFEMYDLCDVAQKIMDLAYTAQNTEAMQNE